MDEIVRELEALERQGWEALSGGAGVAFYDDLMSDDGLMVFPGLVMDKAETLRAVGGAAPWLTFELADVRVVRSTPDGAIVTYEARSQRAGQAPYRATMSSHYARRGGRWRLILHQQSPEPPAA